MNVRIVLSLFTLMVASGSAHQAAAAECLNEDFALTAEATCKEVKFFEVGMRSQVDVHAQEIFFLGEAYRYKFITQRTYCLAVDQIHGQFILWAKRRLEAGLGNELEVREAELNRSRFRSSESCASPFSEDGN